MFRALDTRNLSNQQGLELAGVKMSPAALAVIIARADFIALWTTQLAAVVFYVNLYLFVCQRYVNRRDLPRLRDTKNLGI
jgi:hypothetical protein